MGVVYVVNKLLDEMGSLIWTIMSRKLVVFCVLIIININEKENDETEEKPWEVCGGIELKMKETGLRIKRGKRMGEGPSGGVRIGWTN